MPLPEISFASKEEQLQYATKVLVEAGFTPEQIDRIRNKVGEGLAKFPTTKTSLDSGAIWCKSCLQLA